MSTSQSDALLKLRRQLLRSTTFWRPENVPDGACLLWEVGVLWRCRRVSGQGRICAYASFLERISTHEINRHSFSFR